MRWRRRWRFRSISRAGPRQPTPRPRVGGAARRT
jgi:hypothetical protein